MSGTPEWLDDKGKIIEHKSHLEDYNLEASNKITNKSGKQVNGFWGIQALTAPIIL